MATPQDVQDVWAMLAVAYSQQLGKESAQDLTRKLRLYELMLQDLPGDVLEAAALQHIATGTWFPTIAELRKLAIDLMAPEAAPAIEEWGKVVRAIRAVGHTGTPVFDNPITDRVVKALGWRDLCMADDVGHVANRARFLDGYAAHMRRERDALYTHPAVQAVVDRFTQRIEGGRRNAPDLLAMPE